MALGSDGVENGALMWKACDAVQLPPQLRDHELQVAFEHCRGGERLTAGNPWAGTVCDLQVLGIRNNTPGTMLHIAGMPMINMYIRHSIFMHCGWCQSL
ncbi:MAG: hypothetical protein OXF44_11920 [Anaerolineaceae bacterium]|nr:hypothetical protein [Anaerolineaceae bacterium]MCY4022095.1 hypothetical protein [Anaerolineaceae bacterium]